MRLRRGWLLLAALGGCLDPTEVTVTILTDVPCTKLQGTNIRVGSSDISASVAPSQTQCTADGTIGSIVVLPNAALSNTQIKVVTGVGETADQCDKDGYLHGCIVARRSLSFVSHSKRALPITMEQSCVNVPCDEQSSCVNGACQPLDRIDLDASAPDSAPADASKPDATADASGGVVQFIDARSYTGTTTMPPVVVLPPSAPGDALVVGFLTEVNVGIIGPKGWTASPPITDQATASMIVFVHLVQATDPMNLSFATDSPIVSKRLDVVAAQYRNVASFGVFAGGTSGVVPSVTNSISGSMWLGFFGSLSATAWSAKAPAIARKNTPGLFLEDALATKAMTDSLSVTVSNSGNSVLTMGLLLSPP